MALEKISLRVVLAVAMTVTVMSVLAASLFTGYRRVPSVGNLKAIGVGVYWNSDCTSNVSSIDWGFLEPGENADVTVYVLNEGSVPIVLNMTTDSWNPTLASDYIALGWNRESYVLNPESTVQTVLSLSVSSDVSGVESFSFDIIVTGTETS